MWWRENEGKVDRGTDTKNIYLDAWKQWEDVRRKECDFVNPSERPRF